jgi:hypothetical protein
MQLYERLAHTAGSDWQDANRLHALCERVAARHGQDIHRVRKQLVLRWLQQPAAELPAAEGDGGAFANVNAHAHAGDEAAYALAEQRAVQRIVLVLQPNLQSDKDVRRMVAFLLNYSFASHADPTVTFSARARALATVFAVAPEETVEAVFEQGVRNGAGAALEGVGLRDYQRYCAYMVDLEALRLPHTLEQLVRCDKTGLVQGLWRDMRGNARVVRLVADLVLDFGIQDPKIIAAVLGQMIKMHMPRLAIHYVDRLAGRGAHLAASVKEPFIAAVAQAPDTLHKADVAHFLDTVRSVLLKLPNMQTGELETVVAAVKLLDPAAVKGLAAVIIDVRKRSHVIGALA